MTTNVKLKRSAVPGKIPLTSSLELGELALNTYDGIIYLKRNGISGEEIVTISGIVSGETVINSVFTDNSLVGDGKEATPLSVSGIFGSINIQNRNTDLVNVKLTFFLHNCLRIDPETFRNGSFGKVYTRNNESVNVLV